MNESNPSRFITSSHHINRVETAHDHNILMRVVIANRIKHIIHKTNITQQHQHQQLQHLQQQKRTIMAFGAKKFPSPVIMGDEDIMSKKAHGTSEV